MRNIYILILAVVMAAGSSCSEKAPANFVLIKGGAFKHTPTEAYKNITVSDFYLSRYEITQKEWTAVMGTNPSEFKGNNLPVETVTWYDCLDYCNRRSAHEGLKPYYTINKSRKDPQNTNNLDTVKWIVTVNSQANGYRLPTEVEWEYAASGGKDSKGFTYSGSNSISEVAWYWQNSGDKYLDGSWSWPLLVSNHNKTHVVGGQQPNELGLYDMSGNVREWCWDRHNGKGPEDPQGRIWKGGGWMGGDFCCEPSFNASYEANGKGPDQGFRVCRSK